MNRKFSKITLLWLLLLLHLLLALPAAAQGEVATPAETPTADTTVESSVGEAPPPQQVGEALAQQIFLPLVLGGNGEMSNESSNESSYADSDEAIEAANWRSVSINDVQVNEASGKAVFTVQLSRSAILPVDVSYVTQNGTATAGSDYQPTSGLLTFHIGQSSKTVEVPLINDNVREDNETFQMRLTGATHTALAKSIGTATIADDEALPPAISIQDSTLNESRGIMEFTVSLSKQSDQVVTVSYTTWDGTANGNDYSATNGTLSFPSGVTMQKITVVIKDDTLSEGTTPQLFNVVLSNSAGATIGRGQAQGAIIDNEPLPTVFTNSFLTIREGTGGALNFTLNRPCECIVAVNLNHNASNGFGVSLQPGIYSFQPGQLILAAPYRVWDDFIREAPVTFSIFLSPHMNTTQVTPPTVTVVLHDND